MSIADFNIICKNSKDSGFTNGKTYSVIDGRIIDNEGVPRPSMIKKDFKITSLEDIKNYKEGNWSWIGEFIKATEFRNLY